MELWVATLVMIIAAVGITALAIEMRGKENKIGYIIGIVGTAAVTLAAVGYALLTVLLVNAVE